VTPAQAGVQDTLQAPQTMLPGVPVQLVYTLRHAGGNGLFTDVAISHEEPMHLIVVSRDLQQFQHIHPQPTNRPGQYAVTLTFPMAGTYYLYNQFARLSGADVLLSNVLTVGAPSGPAQLSVDRTPKVSGAVRVALEGADALQSGRPQTLTFRLEDAQTGEPLANLQPYLGAAAHVAILSQDAQTFVHTHGQQAAAMAGAPAANPVGRYGPTISFVNRFPQPGLYKILGPVCDQWRPRRYRQFRGGSSVERNRPMATAVLTVPDISCEHCERAIKGALTPVEGVQRVSVDIPGKQVQVEFDQSRVSVDQMKEILQEEDYPVASVR